MKPIRPRMATEEHFDFAPIRTYAQVAAEMTRRGHPIPVNSIGYYERNALRKIREAIQHEVWL